MNISDLDFIDDIKVESVSGGRAWSFSSGPGIFSTKFGAAPKVVHPAGELHDGNAKRVRVSGRGTTGRISVRAIVWDP